MNGTAIETDDPTSCSGMVSVTLKVTLHPLEAGTRKRRCLDRTRSLLRPLLRGDCCEAANEARPRQRITSEEDWR